MENLNAEQIKKALECCTSYCDKDNCPYKTHDIPIACMTMRMVDALALITSQEQKIKELTEENERLRGILLQFTDIVHKWGNKNGYDTSEISLVPILNEETAIKAKIKADTVRKMLQRIKQDAIAVSLLSNPPKFMLEIREDALDQIAKEMLEGKI